MADQSLELRVMSPRQVREARTRLGRMWGLGRELTPEELALELGLGGVDPGKLVEKWERDVSVPSGPCSRLLQALLAGFRPSAAPDQPEAVARLSGPPESRR